MTVFADVCGLYVYCRLANRIGPVVTTHAIADDIPVVKVGRQPARRCMTVVACITAGYVRRTFSDCRNTVVTGAARAQYLAVIDRKDRCEYIGVMAVLADVGRLNMGRALADSFRTVVAIEAATRDVDVVKIRGQPTDSRVTVVAVNATRYVSWMLADRGYPVMARSAGTKDLCVVNRNHRLKHRGVVAVFANRSRQNVCRTLADSGRAVVTTGTVSGDADMVKNGR